MDHTWGGGRPRGRCWGDEAQRSVLHALAEDLRSRIGCETVAIQAVREDGNAEYVAVVGDPAAREALLGEAVRCEAGSYAAAAGGISGGWLVAPPEPAWPGPHVVRLVNGSEGSARAVVHLGGPYVAAGAGSIDEGVGVLGEAIVAVIEREAYGTRLRMVTQARAAMRAVPRELPTGEFLSETAAAMADTMDLDSVDLLLAGIGDPALEAYAHQVWKDGGHLLVEGELGWDAAGLPVAVPEILAEAMPPGLDAWLAVPVGLGEEYLGLLGLGRKQGRTWTDAEVAAARVVAADLAGVLFDSRRVERELARNAELLAVSEHRRDMVRTLAHELRNPVSVLLSHLELLEDAQPAGVELRSLAALRRASLRIEDMVADLMVLAAATDPHYRQPVAPVDFSSVVRDTIDFLAPVADQGQIKLTHDVAERLVVVGLNAGLNRVAGNLLSNALKYTPAGGRVHVELVAHARGDTDGVRLRFTDTGVGIPPEDLAHVFTPFFRSERPETRRTPGTGLGLAIVDRVATRHGGTVEVTSTLGEGSTFTVWLPTSHDPGA